MSAPRLLAVDLDGTLLARNGAPHEADVRALRAAREEGVVVTILTGRLLAGTRVAARALGLTGLVGCADGAHIVHAVTEHDLLHRTISGERAVQLQQHFKAVPTFLFVGNTVVHDSSGDRFLEYLRTWSPQLERASNVHSHHAWSNEAGLTAVVAVGDEGPIRDAADSIRAQMSGHAQVLSFALGSSGAWGLIARAFDVSKGTALNFIAEHSGVAMADTVAVGDWFNDLPMFEVAGRSYAMQQAPDEVKKRVTATLPESSESGGGIARVVRETFGIRVP